MAKLERNLTGDFDALLEHLHRGLLHENASISCEDGSGYCSAGGLRSQVRPPEPEKLPEVYLCIHRTDS